ncbi:MAG: hypothetical protein HZA77_07715 [Candidatus Schekmanbacteria bacterium]|nr:hypothetical protein [Candidatus Schekmanbacteria bacterium]
MSWIKLALMSVAGIVIIFFVAFYALLTVAIFLAIVITAAVVLVSWKIPVLVGIKEKNIIFMPFFLLNTALITVVLISLLFRVIW